MKRRLALIAPASSLAVLLAVLLSGCATASANDGGYISLESARAIALQRAGVSSADVRWDERDFDFDAGIPVYELDFTSGGYEYSCDVHALTGAVLDYDVERDG